MFYFFVKYFKFIKKYCKMKENMRIVHKSKKKGFTLAEVLITLGIIGVVASLTTPTLVVSSRNKECEAGLRVAYSLLEQTFTKMRSDGLQINAASYPTNTFVSVIREYFLVGEKGGTYSDCTDNTIFVTTPNSNINPDRFDNVYLTYNRSRKIYTQELDDGQFILRNGMLLAFENNVNTRLFISVDVNGKAKGPNVWGIDLFTFQIMDDGRILPMGAEGTFYTNENLYCSKTSSSTSNGIGCTQKALTDESYWKNVK